MKFHVVIFSLFTLFLFPFQQQATAQSGATASSSQGEVVAAASTADDLRANAKKKKKKKKKKKGNNNGEKKKKKAKKKKKGKNNSGDNGGKKKKAKKKKSNKKKGNSGNSGGKKKKKKKKGNGEVAAFSDIPDFFDLLGDSSSSSLSSRAAVGPFPNLVNLSLIGGAEAGFFNDYDSTAAAIASSGATTEACDAYRGSNTDADPSGLTGCYAAEDTLYPWELLLDAHRELCYLGLMHDKRALTEGPVSLVSGSAGNLADLTAALTAADKTIKINVSHPTLGDSSLFVKLPSVDSRDDGYDYQIQTWRCDANSTDPLGYHNIGVTNDLGLEYTAIRSVASGDPLSLDFTVGLAISPDKDIIFGNDARSLTLTATRNDRTFKSTTVGTATNFLTRLYAVHGTSGITRQTITSANHDSANLTSVKIPDFGIRNRFLVSGSGADEVVRGGEFRTLRYVSAPDASPATTVNELSFDEAFFGTAPSTSEIDTTIYSCTAEADVTLSLDLTGSDDMTEDFLLTCDTERPQNTDFCSGDSDITASESNYVANCLS